MEDMEENINKIGWTMYKKFSYPQFYAYLLSPEFIEKYAEKNSVISYWIDRDDIAIKMVAKAIYEHQSWNPQPLIDLLSKI